MAKKMNRKKTEAMINVRAWEDPSFKERLQADPRGALRELGMERVPEGLTIRAVEEGRNEWVIRLHRRPLNFMEMDGRAREKAAAGEIQEAKCCPTNPS
jgi:hypothetical protein